MAMDRTTRLTEDNSYLQLMTAQSQAPYAYLTSMQYQAGCPIGGSSASQPPLTSTCAGLHPGSKGVATEDQMWPSATRDNRARARGHPADYKKVDASGQWALVGADVYKGRGDGLFSPDQVALDCELRAPGLDRLRSRAGRTFTRLPTETTGPGYMCPPSAAQLGFPTPTRYDRVTVMNRF